MLVRIEDTGIPITAKPSDAFGDRGQRYFFVGIHRCAQPREMDGDRSDLLRMGRDSTDGGRPRASNVLKEGRKFGAVHAQPSRKSKIGQCLDGTPV
jgi:hypothetical protein